MAYSWYDRADMMKTTLEAVNHSHSLCEIMYVCEGGMSIETEAGRVELGRRQLVWLDSGHSSLEHEFFQRIVQHDEY